MKNLSLILNGVLLVAVAVLFYLHFSGPKSQNSAGQTPIGDLKFAYIHSDSVLKNYDYFKATRERLEAKGKRLDQELQGRAQQLQGEFDAYQRNANNMTPNQNAIMQEELGKKRQNLQMYQESLSQEMIAEQEKVTKDLYDRVTKFLDTYGKEKGIQAVMKFNTTSDLLYANSAMDISQDVVKGLNEQYKTELASPKPDSVTTKKK